MRGSKQGIPLLTEHLIERLSRTAGSQRTLSEEALSAMMGYDWPGNVRELENCLERACALSSGPVIHVADLPSPLQQALTQAAPEEAVGDKIVPMELVEKQAILAAIEQLDGDKLLAARLLNIGK